MPLKVVHISKALAAGDEAARELWNAVLEPKWAKLAEKRAERLIADLTSCSSAKKPAKRKSNRE